MKRILYLTFYFEPDLSAGSFRNSSLVKELAEQAEGIAFTDVVTTFPNRYKSYHADAPVFEERKNYAVYRIRVSPHKNGMKDQIISFRDFYYQTRKWTKDKKFDLVVASSSKLFTAFLGYKIARNLNVPLYLDIRDLFADTVGDVLKNQAAKGLLLPFLHYIESKVFSYASHINLISAGFREYFTRYKQATYSFFTNGIDPMFLQLPSSEEKNGPKIILYAGNIGEGQGLHKIIPQAAVRLRQKYKFMVIGDGGAKSLLAGEINRLGIKNVEIFPPVARDELLEKYNRADLFFLHLNDLNAFKKVLPSKIFELGAYDKPIIAGVSGYAGEFITKNLSNIILFPPCDVESMVKQLNSFEYKVEERASFKEKFSREAINRDMARSILGYISD